jgi:hypothetical protein
MKALRFVALAVAAIMLDASPAQAQAPTLVAAATYSGGPNFWKASPSAMKCVWNASD